MIINDKILKEAEQTAERAMNIDRAVRLGRAIAFECEQVKILERPIRDDKQLNIREVVHLFEHIQHLQKFLEQEKENIQKALTVAKITEQALKTM